MAVAIESWIRFGAALDGAWLASSGTVWNLVQGQVFEEVGEESQAQARASGLCQGLRESTGAGEGAGETEAMAGNAVLAGALEHQTADEVVNEEVLAQLALDGGGVLAAQVVHLEGGLEVAQAQFHLPAAQEELGEGAEGVAHLLEQGGDEDHFAGAQARVVDAAANEPQGQFGGEPGPEFGGDGARLEGGLAPAHEALVAPEPLAAAEVAALVAPGPHDGVKPVVEAEGEDPPGAEASIAQQDVVRIEVIPELVEELEFVAAPGPGGPGGEEACGEAEEPRQPQDGETAARALDGLLGVALLVGRGVRERDRGTVDDADMMSAPEVLGCEGLDGLGHEGGVNVVEDLQGDGGAGLTIGAVLEGRQG